MVALVFDVPALRAANTSAMDSDEDEKGLLPSEAGLELRTPLEVRVTHMWGEGWMWPPTPQEPASRSSELGHVLGNVTEEELPLRFLGFGGAHTLAVQAMGA